MLTPCTHERANCWNTESRAPCDSCVVQLALAASASGTGKSREKDTSKKGKGMDGGVDRRIKRKDEQEGSEEGDKVERENKGEGRRMEGGRKRKTEG